MIRPWKWLRVVASNNASLTCAMVVAGAALSGCANNRHYVELDQSPVPVASPVAPHVPPVTAKDDSSESDAGKPDRGSYDEPVPVQSRPVTSPADSTNVAVDVAPTPGSAEKTDAGQPTPQPQPLPSTAIVARPKADSVTDTSGVPAGRTIVRPKSTSKPVSVVINVPPQAPPEEDDSHNRKDPQTKPLRDDSVVVNNPEQSSKVPDSEAESNVAPDAAVVKAGKAGKAGDAPEAVAQLPKPSTLQPVTPPADAKKPTATVQKPKPVTPKPTATVQKPRPVTPKPTATVQKPKPVTPFLVSKLRVEPFVGVPQEIHSVSVDKAGNLYLTHDDSITRVQTDGRTQKWAKTVRPRDLISIDNDTFLTCDVGARSLLWLDRNGEVKDRAVESSDGHFLRAPNGLLRDAHGGVYFTDPGFARIRNPIGKIHYMSTTGKSTAVVRRLAYPDGIAINMEGTHVLIVEGQTEHVLAFQILAPGKLGPKRVFGRLSHARGSRKSHPSGLAVDGSGHVYVGRGELGLIDVLNSHGRVLGSISVPDTVVTDVSISGNNRQQLIIAGLESGPKRRGRVWTVDLTSSK